MKKIIANILLALLVASSLAAEEEIKEVKSDWEFNLAPFYVWMMDMDGNVDLGTNSGEVDVPFSDITDNLEAAFIVHFEAMHKSNFGVLVDVLYMDLEGTENVPTSVPFNTQAKVDLDMTVSELSGLYRIKKDEHAFDLIAGMRYVELDLDVSLSSNGPLDGLNPNNNVDWVDPLVGGRWTWDIHEQWSFIARGDVGGFGVGSDFAWQGLGLVEYQPFKHASFLAGYRVIEIDYDEGSGASYFRYNVKTSGPLVGINFKW